MNVTLIDFLFFFFNGAVKIMPADVRVGKTPAFGKEHLHAHGNHDNCQQNTRKRYCKDKGVHGRFKT